MFLIIHGMQFYGILQGLPRRKGKLSTEGLWILNAVAQCCIIPSGYSAWKKELLPMLKL